MKFRILLLSRSLHKRFSDFNQAKIKLQQSIAEKEEKLKETLAKMESEPA